MKKLRFVFYLVVILAILVGTTPALAADNGQPEIQTVRYFFIDDPVIPIGEVVEFVQIDDELVVKWEQRIGRGVYVQYYQFEGVDISFADGDRNSVTYRNPIAGDKGTVAYYAADDNGVVDRMTVDELQQWTKEEFTLIELGNQFYGEMLDKGLFYLVYNADCLPSQYFLNGSPLQAGPYGNTYKVPSMGGNLQAVYYPGECGGNYAGIRWNVHVDPGDAVGGTEEVYIWPLENQNPWGFCNRLEWMRPVWQPETLSYEMDGVCPDLWGKDDPRTMATLAREGFLRADRRYGDDVPEDVTPFVWLGKGHGVEFSWSAHNWQRVSQIQLSTGAVYNVTVAYNGWTGDYMPVITLVGGSGSDTDIPWYEWNTPVLFVSSSKLDHYFDWTSTEVFRVLRWTADKAVIEKLVWTNQ